MLSGAAIAVAITTLIIIIYAMTVGEITIREVNPGGIVYFNGFSH
jgi:hypothetical protein